MTADASQASAALDQHLKDAIAELSPAKGQAVMSRGLSRLKNLTETLVASVEKAAEGAAAELQAAHDEALGAVEGIKTHVGGQFKAATAEVKDLLNQITNEAK